MIWQRQAFITLCLVRVIGLVWRMQRCSGYGWDIENEDLQAPSLEKYLIICRLELDLRMFGELHWYFKRFTIERWLEGTSSSPPWVFWDGLVSHPCVRIWDALLDIDEVLELDASVVAFIATLSWPLCWYLWSWDVDWTFVGTSIALWGVFPR